MARPAIVSSPWSALFASISASAVSECDVGAGGTRRISQSS